MPGGKEGLIERPHFCDMFEVLFAACNNNNSKELSSLGK